MFLTADAVGVWTGPELKRLVLNSARFNSTSHKQAGTRLFYCKREFGLQEGARTPALCLANTLAL